MRNLRQAGDRGRLHGLREGLPQGMLQVLRLQEEDWRKVLRKERETLLLQRLRGDPDLV